jgi:hypothetical protein
VEGLHELCGELHVNDRRAAHLNQTVKCCNTNVSLGSLLHIVAVVAVLEEGAELGCFGAKQ